MEIKSHRPPHRLPPTASPLRVLLLSFSRFRQAVDIADVQTRRGRQPRTGYQSADSRRVDSPRGERARESCHRAPSAAGRHLVIPFESAATKAGFLRKLIPELFGRKGRDHKMRRSIFLITVVLVMWDLTESEEAKAWNIKAEDREDKILLTCENGKWDNPLDPDNAKMHLDYKDEASGEYHCVKDQGTRETILVKLRTCDNCIQLEMGAILGVIIGDILATFLIGVAVYFVASQPKARTYGSSYSKASDRQNLIQNQQNDTYMPLQGQSSEYSKLERRANRK